MSLNYFFRTTAILLFYISNLYAQTGNIVGVVKDGVTGDALPGANVYFIGTSIGTATDIEGDFRIRGIDVGTYPLAVKYIGYKEIQDTITIVEGSTLQLEFELYPDVLETEEVEVLAQAQGQIAAINQQLSSNTIVNIISEEKIQELPDANAAEAIGRLPGVSIQREGGEANKIVLRGMSSKYTAITIDGVRIAATDSNGRGVDLSMISQGSLAGIELYKALTSDKDADAIAGSVNLVTRKAPSERRLRFEGEGIYSDIDNSANQYGFSLKYGERFFDNLLGVQFTGNTEKRNRSNENSKHTWETQIEGGTDYRLREFDINYAQEIKKRTGFSLLLDFETPDNGIIKLNGIFNSTTRDRNNYLRNYGGTGAGAIEYMIKVTETEISSFNGSLTGDNYIFGMDLNWGLSYARSEAEVPYSYQLDFIEATEIEYDDDDNPIYVQGMRPIPESMYRGPAEGLIPYAVNNFDKAFMNWGRFRNSTNNQDEKTIFLNFSRNFSFGSLLDLELKAGAKYRSMSRFRESNSTRAPYYNMALPEYTVASDGSIVEKNYTGSSFENLIYESGRIVLRNFLDPNVDSRDIFDQYSLNPLINVDMVREWYDANRDGRVDPAGTKREYQINTAEIINYYDLTENVGAGYIMATAKLGNTFTLLAGVRVENENNSYSSRYSIAELSGNSNPENSVFDTTSTFNETVWLPNLQMNIAPADFLNIRLAAYKALARPGYNQRLMKYIGQSGSQPSVTMGNPGLKAAKAWNYEVSTSIFSNTIGLITLAGYYKVIEDMHHVTNRISVQNSDEIPDALGIDWNIPFKRYELTYPYNSPGETKIWGFEIDHQINFFFLPGLLRNIVLSYNFSINRSETIIYQTEIVKVDDSFPPKFTTVLTEAKTSLEGQSELFGNVALGYDIGGFSARVSVFFQEPYTFQHDSDGRAERFENSFGKWDLLLRQQITDNIALLFKLNNITDYYEGSTYKNNIFGWNLPLYDQRFGRTGNLVLRVDL